jgi:hypothetical protein
MIPGLCSLVYPRPGTVVGSFSAITDSSYQEAFGNGYQTTGPITASPIGGIGPYTYAWTIDGTATLTDPTMAETQATYFLNVDDFATFNARCVITDSTSNTAQTPDVTFAFHWEP